MLVKYYHHNYKTFQEAKKEENEDKDKDLNHLTKEMIDSAF